MNKKHYIVCPHCGAEYLPAEVLVSEGSLGEPTGIVKDEFGRIVYYGGTDIDMHDVYECDYCNRPFSVVGDVRFATRGTEDDDEFSIEVYDGRISLFEEDD